MKKKIMSHLAYYAVLLIIFGLGLWACFLAFPNVGLQAAIIFATIISYMLWGMIHHKKNHQLTAKIMIEYILIGVLGLSMIFFIFMGGAGI